LIERQAAGVSWLFRTPKQPAHAGGSPHRKQEILHVGNKLWAILFGVVMLACAAGFAVAPLVPSLGWWRPEGISTHSGEVDFLFDIIAWITTFFFFLTEGLLVLFLWKYASGAAGKRPVSAAAEMPGFIKPIANLLYDQHRVELAWTLVPALILLYIAFAQVNTWANIKYESRRDVQAKDQPASLQVGVSARQFEWRIRYPSVGRFKNWLADKEKNKVDITSFGKVPQADDVYTVNELHIWQYHQVVVHLTTRDVIHSFNLPNFRVKQDALPGKMIPVWFKTRDPKDYESFNCKWDEKKHRYVDGINPKTGEHDNAFIYDIPCAELCGWGHYRMIGRVFVHKDQADFLIWLTKAEEENRRRTPER
jgi:cytochrome c oxidase subunit II